MKNSRVAKVWVLVVACMCVCAQTCAPIEALDETGRILCGTGGQCPTGYSCRAARCCKTGVSSANCPLVRGGDPGWLCEGGACRGGQCVTNDGVGYCSRPDSGGGCGPLGVTITMPVGVLGRDRRAIACLSRCPLDSAGIATTCTLLGPGEARRGGQCIPIDGAPSALEGGCVIVCGSGLPACPTGLQCLSVPGSGQRICAPPGVFP